MDNQELTQGEKIIGSLSYIFFFLPLINKNQKDFNRFHANQGLLFLILTVGLNGVNIAISYFPYINWLFMAFSTGVLVWFFYLGISSAAAGEMREFPVMAISGSSALSPERKTDISHRKEKPFGFSLFFGESG